MRYLSRSTDSGLKIYDHRVEIIVDSDDRKRLVSGVAAYENVLLDKSAEPADLDDDEREHLDSLLLSLDRGWSIIQPQAYLSVLSPRTKLMTA